jgi:hypothetical protein
MARADPRSTDTKFETRLAAVEQVLPALATKEDLRSAIADAVAPLATREEMGRAIAPLATREELYQAIAPLASREELYQAVAPLARREEVYQAIREEGERTRRHFDVVAEDLRGDVRLLAEGQVALYQRNDDLRAELKGETAALDRRVTRLEAARETRVD